MPNNQKPETNTKTNTKKTYENKPELLDAKSKHPKRSNVWSNDWSHRWSLTCSGRPWRLSRHFGDRRHGCPMQQGIDQRALPNVGPERQIFQGCYTWSQYVKICHNSLQYFTILHQKSSTFWHLDHFAPTFLPSKLVEPTQLSGRPAQEHHLRIGRRWHGVEGVHQTREVHRGHGRARQEFGGAVIRMHPASFASIADLKSRKRKVTIKWLLGKNDGKFDMVKRQQVTKPQLHLFVKSALKNGRIEGKNVPISSLEDVGHAAPLGHQTKLAFWTTAESVAST